MIILALPVDPAINTQIDGMRLALLSIQKSMVGGWPCYQYTMNNDD
jgi:hypothetical protein